MMQYGVHLDALSPLALRAWILLLWICTEATRWTHKETFVVAVEIRPTSMPHQHPLNPFDGHLSQWDRALPGRLKSH